MQRTIVRYTDRGHFNIRNELNLDARLPRIKSQLLRYHFNKPGISATRMDRETEGFCAIQYKYIYSSHPVPFTYLQPNTQREKENRDSVRLAARESVTIVLRRMDPEERKEKFYLLEDVIVEILSKLPVKPLLRFKSVCTQWRALISSSSFNSLHLKCSISNPTRHSILVHTDYGNNFIPFDPLTYSPFSNLDIYCSLSSFGQTVLFVGSINGLLCICGSSGKWICLWNPSTRLFRKFRTGINRCSSSFSVGFGYDLIANDYKVVVMGLRRQQGVTRMGVKVWSANLDSWREIKVDCDFTPRKHVCDAMVKGFAYWIVREELGSNSRSLVASFDMSTDILRLVPVPECYSHHIYAFYGLIWKDNFALAAIEGAKIYQVWTIENDSVGKESWVKKFTFELDFGFSLCTLNAGNGKLLYNRESKILRFYDLETTEKKAVETQKYNYLASGAHYYVESLLSIKGFKHIKEYQPTILYYF